MPTLLYGSGTRVSRKKDESRTQAVEVSILISVEGCTHLDRMRNDEVREDLGIFSIQDKTELYTGSWREHAEKMPKEKINNFNYHPLARTDTD